MTRRHRKDALPATRALAVPGLRVVVTGPDQAPAPTTARTAAKAAAPGASTQHRKRRAKFVF